MVVNMDPDDKISDLFKLKALTGDKILLIKNSNIEIYF